MNANEFADELEKAPTLWFKDDIAGKWIIEKLRQQQAEIEELKTCLIVEQKHNERMVEDRSKYEALAHAGGVEAGKELKELTDEDKSMLIRTLKWSEDLLRITGNDEAVSDVQDCLMILRKAQEK
jgi:Flp pilus assembly CpaE family ATPase